MAEVTSCRNLAQDFEYQSSNLKTHKGEFWMFRKWEYFTENVLQHTCNHKSPILFHIHDIIPLKKSEECTVFKSINSGKLHFLSKLFSWKITFGSCNQSSSDSPLQHNLYCFYKTMDTSQSHENNDEWEYIGPKMPLKLPSHRVTHAEIIEKFWHHPNKDWGIYFLI